MGYGDCLLAAGLAERMVREHPDLGPVTIANCDGRPRWRAEWDGNPAIASGSKTGHTLRIGRGCLPWNPFHRDSPYRVRDAKPHLILTPAELAVGAAVRAQYGRFILVEPTGRDRKNRNRDWGHENWKRLVAELTQLVPDWTLVQLDRPMADRVGSLTPIPHRSFREACAIMQAADLAILPEGGLAVGAIAVNAPAVVLWGGCVSAEHFGVPEHLNLVDDDPRSPCESTKPCEHCAEAWARLTPASVATSVLLRLGHLDG